MSDPMIMSTTYGFYCQEKHSMLITSLNSEEGVEEWILAGNDQYDRREYTSFENKVWAVRCLPLVLKSFPKAKMVRIVIQEEKLESL